MRWPGLTRNKLFHLTSNLHDHSLTIPPSLQRAPNPPEFAQPRLSRVQGRSSPARGYKFGCVCSYMACLTQTWDDTGHVGTNTPKFVPSRWGWPPLDPTQMGLCKFGWAWSSLITFSTLPQKFPAFFLKTAPIFSGDTASTSTGRPSCGNERILLWTVCCKHLLDFIVFCCGRRRNFHWSHW